MKTTRILVLSAALIASVLISVSASAQQEAPKHVPQGFGQKHEINPEKAAEMRAKHMQKAYNLDEKSYKQLVKHYKKEFKEMEKNGAFRKAQEKELETILGPENYKQYKADQHKGRGPHPGHGPQQHGNGHHHAPDHNHVQPAPGPAEQLKN